MKRKRSKRRTKAQINFDNYKKAQLSLHKEAFLPPDPNQCRVIRITKMKYLYNHQHIRVLTTGLGSRFQIG
jgi:hypothetical protein